ncbi:MAG: efflux RND transporter periplasmic adaptor subunit [bacterium]|nr:efflux RND transporter periplasmic adaptor subunit [bacterium]
MTKSSIALIGMIAAAMIAQGCGQKAATEAAKAPAVIPVLVQPAREQRVEYTYDQVGALKAFQEVVIKAETAGAITEINFKEGQPVSKDDVLVKLEDDKIQAQIRNNDASLQQLEVRLANRKKERERNEPLVKSKLVSPQQFDDIVADINELEAMIAQAKAARSLNQERLADTLIRAPFDATAGARSISIGDFVEVGDPVVTLVALDPLEIQFQALERELPRISIGQDVSLNVDAYPDRTFHGTVYFISPRVDDQTRTAEIKARIDNGDRLLKPGMFARVSLITEVHERAVVVPTESIIRTEDEYFLYYVENGAPHKLVVQIGKRTPDWSEVITDPPVLHEGVPIIVEGKYAVKEGAEIQILDAPAAVESTEPAIQE